jgi:alpha-galactosidase
MEGQWDQFLSRLKDSPVRIEPSDAVAQVKIERRWEGDTCHTRITNLGASPVRVGEVVLFDLAHGLPGDTSVYAESFQMLGQNGGTLAQPADIGSLPDRTHYRIPEPPGFRAAAGFMLLSPAGAPNILLGFTSCRKFNGRFYYNATRLQVACDTENLELQPGASWDMEALLAISGAERDALLDALGDAIQINHPRLKHDPPPVGWCSWYCFGPGVTAANIEDNLDWAAAHFPALRYIQIDDGYQPHMGDWLDTGPSFGGGIQQVLKDIAAKGFEPALWVAPFIAGGDSRLFKEHPDWFVKGVDGAPLRSDTVGFGGWRMGPWYALDGTHPEAQQFLEDLFRTLRRDWGCTYFKLDANYWGAIHGGVHHDPAATRIEAYRRGMQAILRGAGDAFVLGCNAPMWPSLGLVHGQRMSMDIDRSWGSFKQIARENFYRAWQNGRLWWNDPDCVVLTGNLKEEEFIFHATAIYATGGLLLSGDNLPSLSPARLEMLRKMTPPTGVPARFVDNSFTVGRMPLGKREMVALFNWGEEAATRSVPLQTKSRIKDYWTGADLGVHEREYSVKNMPPHSARLLEIMLTNR